MNFSVQTLIEKVAYENLWEIRDGFLAFRSMRHAGRLVVTEAGGGLTISLDGFISSSGALAAQSFACDFADFVPSMPLLAREFRALAEYASQPMTTEQMAEAKRRIGHGLYKKAQLDLWGGACAVTGITEPALLRASHAKPWSESTDAQRLDPYNGFPLAVHLDALFDARLISFADDGHMLISPSLSADVRKLYGLSESLTLRRAPDPRHLPYLRHHRSLLR